MSAQLVWDLVTIFVGCTVPLLIGAVWIRLADRAVAHAHGPGWRPRGLVPAGLPRVRDP